MASKTKLGTASSTGIFATQKKAPAPKANAQRTAERAKETAKAASVTAAKKITAPDAKKYNFSNPNDVARFQADQNKYNNAQSLLTNRVNQSNAYGSDTYVTDPKTGKTTRVNALSDTQQKALDTIQGGAQTSLNQATQNFSQPLNYDNVTQVAGGNDLAKFQNDTTNQVFNSLKGRADTQTKNLQKDFDQKMADQGVPIGSDLYNRLRTQNVDQPTNDLYNQLQAQAVQEGQSQAQQVYGQSLQSHQQGVQDTTSLYNAPAQSAATLYGLQSSGIVNPQYDPTYNQQYNNVDTSGAASEYGNMVSAGATTSAAQTKAMADRDVANINAAGGVAQIKAQQPSAGAQLGALGGTIFGGAATELAKAAAPAVVKYFTG